MKKLFVMLAVLAFTASAAVAAYELADGTGKTLGSNPHSLTVKGSKGVYVEYLADTANGQGYIIGTYHQSGTKTYASSSGDTKIFYKDNTANAVPTTVPTGSDSADFTGWTAL